MILTPLFTLAIAGFSSWSAIQPELILGAVQGKGKKPKGRSDAAAMLEQLLKPASGAGGSKTENPLFEIPSTESAARRTIRHVPAEILERFSRGEVSREETLQIAQRLAFPNQVDPAEAADLAETEAKVADPLIRPILDHFARLEKAGDRQGETQLAMQILLHWFGSMDANRDEVVSFLEFRDRSPFGLREFVRLDHDEDGRISLVEFAGPLAETAQAMKIEVQEELLAWIEKQAVEEEEVAPRPAPVLDAESLARVRRAELVLARAKMVLTGDESDLEALQEKFRGEDETRQQLEKAQEKRKVASRTRVRGANLRRTPFSNDELSPEELKRLRGGASVLANQLFPVTVTVPEKLDWGPLEDADSSEEDSSKEEDEGEPESEVGEPKGDPDDSRATDKSG